MRATRSHLRRLAIAAGLAGLAAGCSDFIRQDRSPVTLVIDLLEAAPGSSTTFSGTLQSDVVTPSSGVATVVSDTGRVTLRMVMKDVAATPSAVNAVTITQYRVTFRRADGQNSAGVDVPQPFSSAITFTVPTGGTVQRTFELVRQAAKSEPPLGALASGSTTLSTLADVTFFGRDQAGNDLSVMGTIGVQFGNF